jgi:hypothetical protein
MQTEYYSKIDEKRIATYTPDAIQRAGGIESILRGGQISLEPNGRGVAHGLYLKPDYEKPNSDHINFVKELFPADDCRQLYGDAFAALCTLDVMKINELRRCFDESGAEEARKLLWDVYMTN